MARVRYTENDIQDLHLILKNFKILHLKSIRIQKPKLNLNLQPFTCCYLLPNHNIFDRKNTLVLKKDLPALSWKGPLWGAHMGLLCGPARPAKAAKLAINWVWFDCCCWFESTKAREPDWFESTKAREPSWFESTKAREPSWFEYWCIKGGGGCCWGVGKLSCCW